MVVRARCCRLEGFGGCEAGGGGRRGAEEPEVEVHVWPKPKSEFVSVGGAQEGVSKSST